MPSGAGAVPAGTTDQSSPFQCSTKAWPPDTWGMMLGRKLSDRALGPANPTAQQSDAVEQVTELNWSWACPDGAVGAKVQLLPFQWSMKPSRGSALESSVTLTPVAQQSVALTQVTENSSPWAGGEATTDQFDPSHRSNSGTGVPPPDVPWAPTAQQSEGLTQVTSHSAENFGPRGAADGSTVQAVPSQCSNSAVGWECWLLMLSMVTPAAQQSHAVAQVVPKRKLLEPGTVVAPLTMVQPEVEAAWAAGTAVPKTTTMATSRAPEASAALAPRPRRRFPSKSCMQVHRHGPRNS